MSENKTFDVVVIGGGPGGYVAAIRCAQLGMQVALVEKRATLGGTCLNVGCIPSKALLYSTHLYAQAKNQFNHHGIGFKDLSLDLDVLMRRKEKVVNDLTQGVAYLMKKNKIFTFTGEAKLTSPTTVSVAGDTLTSTHVILATGSVSAPLQGVEVDEEYILSSTGVLSLKSVPASLIVIGGGYIGLEMGSVWARLGTQVTVLEYAPTIVPQMDGEVQKSLQKILSHQGLSFRLGVKVTSAEKDKNQVRVTFASTDTGSAPEVLTADRVLLSVGRRPAYTGLGLENLGVKFDARGFIEIDDQFQTTVPSIFAIGDLVRGPMLAHKAMEEGVSVAEKLGGRKTVYVNYDAIPAVIYTEPEVASVGQTEEQLKQSNVPYKIGKYPLSANSRAKTMGAEEGFVKILAHATTDEILGVHILGCEAGTLIGELALGREYRASSEDIAYTPHAHPTLSEAIKEAALSALGHGLHM